MGYMSGNLGFTNVSIRASGVVAFCNFPVISGSQV